VLPSVAALVLAAGLLEVPFGSPVEVHVPPSATTPASGAVVGDFLVVGSRHGAESMVVTLRPLALGVLAVPLPGAQPATVDVRPTLAAGASPRPLLVPAPPTFPWVIVAAPVATVALILLAIAALRRHGHRDPVADLQRALAPLAVPDGWEKPGAADALARGCRGFLRAVTGSPCEAMTTRELSRLLAARVDISCAAPFGLALVLADEARFAGLLPPADEAATLVRGLLEVMPAVGGRP
jgi:hypothetical protein